MRDLENELKNKKIDYDKLIEYGFKVQGDLYTYKTGILNNQFEMIVQLSKNQYVSKVIDLANEDEYVLVDIEDATGEFVGRVRSEYEEKLQKIFENCTTSNKFKMEQTQNIIDYIKEKYGDEPEFLWEKFDNNAIWRNKKNQKWYGLLVTLPAEKLKINEKGNIEIIVIRYPKDEILNVIDNKKIFPGYHMNKQNWITVKLDETFENEEIFEMIDNSYSLSLGAKGANDLAEKVYNYLKLIPKGKVVTYGQIGEYLGNKGLARAVGNILHKNPDGDKYPCYKVLNSQGELAEAFVFGGKNVQKERLENEGIEVVNGRVDLRRYQWRSK